MAESSWHSHVGHIAAICWQLLSFLYELPYYSNFNRILIGIGPTVNLVLNSLNYCEPVERFENRNDMMKCWSSSDGTGGRIESKLKTANLSSWTIKQKTIAIVGSGVNERSSNS